MGIVPTDFLSTQVPQESISFCRFKMYLSWILGEHIIHQNEVLTEQNPLCLYKNEPRLKVGNVIMENPDDGDPSAYIPPFYHEGISVSKRMQRPLAHLYFFTVLGHALKNDRGLPETVNSAEELYKVCWAGDSDPAVMVVLQVELQAVIQVIAKLLANVVLCEPDFIRLERTIKSASTFLEDVRTGGGADNSHGIVVAFHMLRNLKSSKKFVQVMTEDFKSRCNEITALHPIHKKMKVTNINYSITFVSSIFISQIIGKQW